MGHGHTHEISAAGRNKRPLMIVFCLTFFYLIVEVIGGIWTGSLALLADAGHMLTDVAGVGLALLAIWFAERPASPERTYGYYRVEILAALTNAVVLIFISLYILYEAYERFRAFPNQKSSSLKSRSAVAKSRKRPSEIAKRFRMQSSRSDARLKALSTHALSIIATRIIPLPRRFRPFWDRSRHVGRLPAYDKGAEWKDTPPSGLLAGTAWDLRRNKARRTKADGGNQ